MSAQFVFGDGLAHPVGVLAKGARRAIGAVSASRQDDTDAQMWVVGAYGFQGGCHVRVTGHQYQLLNVLFVLVLLAHREAVHLDRNTHIGFFFLQMPDIDLIFSGRWRFMAHEPWRSAMIEAMPSQMHFHLVRFESAYVGVLSLFRLHAPRGEFGLYRGGEVMDAHQLAGWVLFMDDGGEKGGEIQPLVWSVREQAVIEVVSVNKKYCSQAALTNQSLETKKPAFAGFFTLTANELNHCVQG